MDLNNSLSEEDRPKARQRQIQSICSTSDSIRVTTLLPLTERVPFHSIVFVWSQ